MWDRLLGSLIPTFAIGTIIFGGTLLVRFLIRILPDLWIAFKDDWIAGCFMIMAIGFFLSFWTSVLRR